MRHSYFYIRVPVFSYGGNMSKKNKKKSESKLVLKKSGTKGKSKRVKENFISEFNVSPDRKRMVRDFIFDTHYSPMKEKEIAAFLQVEKEDRNELARILQELVEENQIERNKRGRFIKGQNHVYGTYTSNAKGFGFVTVEGRSEDIYISEYNTGGAFLGDTVEVKILPDQGGRRTEGKVTQIVTRAITSVVGTYESSRTFGFVHPDNNKIPNDIFIPKEKSRGAVDGDKVVVELTYYGDIFADKKPEGIVSEIIGNVNDPGVDIMSIVKGYDLPNEFPERVKNQAERTADTVSEADCAGRQDLRDVMMVTIDGEESKDLDDAVSLTIDDNGLYHLGVHIADVANYVQEGSALDREAKKRGTSVYLVDRVIPMLPHKLSNGICSLNHGEDRLAMSCLMTIDKSGDIIDHEIVESVINVDERMTYTSVSKIILDHDEEEMAKYEKLVPMFEQMYELAKILKKKRHERGGIDFETQEAKIILDREGNPLDIIREQRDASHELIEDFMLAANETVAQHFYWLQTPFVYRSHEQPSAEKIDTLKTFIKGFGYVLSTKGQEIRPMEIQKLMQKIEGTPEEAIISRVALRSMMQAKYTTECMGHFGLALNYYCHFTSPIRRYPDLQIHRIIKDVIRGRMNDTKIAHYNEILPDIAVHCSKTERRADDAERDTDKLKKAQFMEQHIGECFDGVVSGVTAWGMFVELDNTCEGLIRLSSMYDYYIFDQQNMCLVGEESGITYHLGQKVRIKVIGADRLEKSIDFAIVEDWMDEDSIKVNRESYRHKKVEEARKSKELLEESGLDEDVEEFDEDYFEEGYFDEDELASKLEELLEMEPERFDEEDNLMTPAEKRALERKKELLKNYEPDGRTGKPRPKKVHKKYKVHKFKKSATSKAQRDKQKKKRK